MHIVYIVLKTLGVYFIYGEKMQERKKGSID